MVVGINSKYRELEAHVDIHLITLYNNKYSNTNNIVCTVNCFDTTVVRIVRPLRIVVVLKLLSTDD